MSGLILPGATVLESTQVRSEPAKQRAKQRAKQKVSDAAAVGIEILPVCRAVTSCDRLRLISAVLYNSDAEEETQNILNLTSWEIVVPMPVLVKSV